VKVTVVDALPQLGDLSFLVGFVVASVVYYALTGSGRAIADASSA
jgi:hypothetical protein